jgi:hypothetical protein
VAESLLKAAKDHIQPVDLQKEFLQKRLRHLLKCLHLKNQNSKELKLAVKEYRIHIKEKTHEKNITISSKKTRKS